MSWFDIDLKIRNNAHCREAFQYVDETTGQPVVLTGATFRADFKTSVEAGAPTLSLTSPVGIELTDLAAGIFTLVFAPGAIPPGTYVYDLIMTLSGEKPPLMVGTLTVEKGITP